MSPSERISPAVLLMECIGTIPNQIIGMVPMTAFPNMGSPKTTAGYCAMIDAPAVLQEVVWNGSRTLFGAIPMCLTSG